VYAITDRLPYDFKRLRAYVRENHVGALTIKKRGVDVDPAALRRQLRPAGDNDATFVITRVANRAAVLVATAVGVAGQ
jgi:hypothetical protein